MKQVPFIDPVNRHTDNLEISLFAEKFPTIQVDAEFAPLRAVPQVMCAQSGKRIMVCQWRCNADQRGGPHRGNTKRKAATHVQACVTVKR